MLYIDLDLHDVIVDSKKVALFECEWHLFSHFYHTLSRLVFSRLFPYLRSRPYEFPTYALVNSIILEILGKFLGVETHELSKCPGVGTKKEGKCPAPRSSPSKTSAVFILIGEFVVLWNLLQSHLTKKRSGGVYYNVTKLLWDCGGCPTATRDDGHLYSHATFSAKNQDF